MCHIALSGLGAGLESESVAGPAAGLESESGTLDGARLDVPALDGAPGGSEGGGASDGVGPPASLTLRCTPWER